MLLKFNQTKISNPRTCSKGHNKEHPDCTVSREGIEYDMSLPIIKGLYYSERLREAQARHETLNKYESELDKDANYHQQIAPNPALEHARSVKIARHRTLLPSLLF